MADKLTPQELLHNQRMERAVRALRGNDDLRYLFRQLFLLCGADGQVDLTTTNTVLYSVGRKSVSTDVAAVLMQYDVTLYADMLREDALESITEEHSNEE